MNRLEERLRSIKPVDKDIYIKVQARLDNLTKPRGSLGRLEELAKRYVAITQKEEPKIIKKIIYTFAGDHGVTEEGVSLYPKEVTPQMVYNFLKGGAGINVLARHINAEVRVVDIGVDHEFGKVDRLIQLKINKGTGNIANGPAMARDDAIKAMEVGIGLADEALKDGADIIGTGDMGIGNTTPSSAIAAVVTGESVESVTGRGTGIDDHIFRKKVETIKRAIKKNNPDPADPIDILAKLGGLEIAGIAGLIIGAAANRIPVMVDGFISTAGALIASEMNIHIKDYLFASHQSVEQGHRAMLNRIGLKPLLDLDLRLGEGTGACLGINILEAGVKILTEMATFGEAEVSPARPAGGKEIGH